MDEKVYLYKTFSSQELYNDFVPLSEWFAALIGEDFSNIITEPTILGFRFYRRSFYQTGQADKNLDVTVANESLADQAARDFIIAYNQGVNDLYTDPIGPKVGYPWLIPNSLAVKDIYSTGVDCEMVWYCDYLILLKVSEERQATAVQGAKVSVAVEANGRVSMFDFEWKPLKARSAYNPTDPKLYFRSYVEEQMVELDKKNDKKQPVGPTIIYLLNHTENLLVPYYAGSLIPVIAEEQVLKAQIESPCPDDDGTICTIYDLPLWQLELLFGLGIELNQIENNHWFLTNLHKILNAFQLLQQKHLDGDFPINTKNDDEELYFSENDTRKWAGYIVKRKFGKLELSSIIELAYPNCRAVFFILYEDYDTGLKLELDSPYELSFPCVDPDPPPSVKDFYPYPNYENTFAPDATLVVIPRTTGLEIFKPTVDIDKSTVLPEGSIAIKTEKFKKVIEDLNVVQIQYTDALNLGLLGADAHIPGFDKGLYFNIASSNVTPNKLIGEMGEQQFKKNVLDFTLNRNLELAQWKDKLDRTRRGNFPIFDSQSGPFSKKLISVKASSHETYQERRRYYRDNGLYDITGGDNNQRSELFNRISEQLTPENLSGKAAQENVLQRAILAVNKDDVYLFREDFKVAISENPQKFSRTIDSLLSETPIDINGRKYNSLQSIDEALKNSQITDEQKVGAIEKLALRMSKKIISNGITTEQINRISDLAANLTREEVMTTLRPEDIFAARLGNSIAISNAGIRGAGMGLFSSGVSQLLTSEDVNYVHLGASAFGEGMGAMTEVQASMALRRVGMTSALSRGWISCGVGGGIAMPLTEIGVMLLDDVGYTAEDYWGRTVRVSVGGVISGASSTYAVGIIATTTAEFTAAGTIAPGAGNLIGFAVGFIVGVISYLIYDHLAGDDVESATRNIHRNLVNDEFYLVGNWEVEDFLLFPIVKKRVEKEDNIVVRTTGSFVSKINPINDHEMVFLEIEPESDEAEDLFGEMGYEFVPRDMLKRKLD